MTFERLQTAPACEVEDAIECRVLQANLMTIEGVQLYCGERCLSGALMSADITDHEMAMARAVTQHGPIAAETSAEIDAEIAATDGNPALRSTLEAALPASDGLAERLEAHVTEIFNG